jgi:hypothetical protein
VCRTRRRQSRRPAVGLGDLVWGRWAEFVVELSQIGIEKSCFPLPLDFSGNGTLCELGQGEAEILRGTMQILWKPDVDSWHAHIMRMLCISRQVRRARVPARLRLRAKLQEG